MLEIEFQDYGPLLLYKLTAVLPDDDLETLAGILRAALPPALFEDTLVPCKPSIILCGSS